MYQAHMQFVRYLHHLINALNSCSFNININNPYNKVTRNINIYVDLNKPHKIRNFFIDRRFIFVSIWCESTLSEFKVPYNKEVPKRFIKEYCIYIYAKNLKQNIFQIIFSQYMECGLITLKIP